METAATPVLRLTLPLPPNMANWRGSKNWRAVAGAKAAYKQAAYVRVLQQTRAVDRAATVADRFIVRATLYVWGEMDEDNAVARLKPALDALQAARVLFNDKKPWCRLHGIPEQFVDRKNQRLELTIERAA